MQKKRKKEEEEEVVSLLQKGRGGTRADDTARIGVPRGRIGQGTP